MISIRKTLATLSLAAFAGVMTNAASAAVLIDSFDTDQAVLTVNSGVTSASSSVFSAGGDILGGWRDILIEYQSGTGDSTAKVENGALSVSNEAGVPPNSSMTTVTWDGAGVGGLGGVDLTGMSAFGILVDVLQSDLGGTLMLTIVDTDADSDTLSIILPEVTFGTPEQFLFAFAGFSPAVNLTAVDSIALKVTGPAALDLSVDIIETAVPEPTSMILLGTALLGLGIRRRYAKK